MTDPTYTGGRLRAYFQFLAAFLYFFFARLLAFHGARGLVGDAWIPLADKAMLVFLLLLCCYGTGVLLYVLLWICLPEPLRGEETPGASSGSTASAAR